MSEAGLWELIVIFVLALLILGPERLPVVARKVGYWVGKVRRYVNNLKSDVEREFRSEELEKMLMEQRQEINNLRTIVSETRAEANKAMNETSEALNSAVQEVDQPAAAIASSSENAESAPEIPPGDNDKK